MIVKLIEKPSEADWLAVKRRALVTVGKEAKTPPTEEWKHRILEARHSPIRRLNFAFYLELPSWVSVHLVRHVHAQPYVKSQRNDRQSDYDRTKAPQDAPVCMIWDINAEELMTIANKHQRKRERSSRLCVRSLKWSSPSSRVCLCRCANITAVCVTRCSRATKMNYENWIV